MRICLTGANGLLGSAIKEACTLRNWTCKIVSRDAVNFRNPQSIEIILEECDVMIHAAANTNVEGCEIDPHSCYRDNTLMTEIIAEAAARRGVQLVYISSTGVYGDAKDQPYHEYDLTRPTTHHHMSKRLGEKATLKFRDSLVIRTGWLFGGSYLNSKNFVARRIEEAALSDGVIYSNSEQRGNPTYIKDLAQYLFRLIEDGQHGIFNCVNKGVASRMEYVAKIVESTGFLVDVRPSTASSFNRLAKVSNNEMAINLKLLQCGYEELPDWKESLTRYISEELKDFVKKLG